MDRDAVLQYLRLGQEPGRVFDEAAIHGLLMDNVLDFMDWLERFYHSWCVNKRLVDQPKKLVFSNDTLKGDWRVMPCMINRFEGRLIKVVKVIGTNEEQRVVNDKICVGKALLLDEFDNHVKAVFDVCALSSFRTAAICALAYKYSGCNVGSGVGIAGCGRIGFYLLYILSRWLKTETFCVYDINEQRVEAFKQLVGCLSRVEIKPALNALLDVSRAVFMATDSRFALLNERNAGHLEFIASVGADADNLSEIDYSLMQDRTLLSESRQNMAIGDMWRWRRQGLLDESTIVELSDWIGGLHHSARKILFVSTGTAVQDALACEFISSLKQNADR